MNRPDVSIIIVSWNTKAHLARCLSAIVRAAEGLTVEVIVVDNGSSDGTQTMLTQQFPHVRLIQNQENLGFGRANNIGARESRGRTLLLLNSDCDLAPGVLKTMIDALEQDPALGGLFCRLLNPDGSLQPSVHRSFPSPWSLLGDLCFLPSIRYALYRRPALHRWLLRSTIRTHQRAQDVAWGGGACMLIRRTAFEAVGGFDERFFLYCEDLDLCKRLRDAGYRLRYVPEPSAIHHWGASTVQTPAAVLREAYRSRVYYFEKHFPGWGGTVARWMTVGELGIRRAVLTLLALVPTPHRQACRDRAWASAACLQDIGRFHGHPAERQAHSRPDGLYLFLSIVVLFSLFRYFHELLKYVVESPFIDFAHYYTYATLVALGQDPFDPAIVARVDDLLQIRRAGAAANYPPLFYLFMQPWVWLPFRPATLLWFTVNQLCLLGALVFCFRHGPPPSPVRVGAVLFVVLNYQPLMESLALGQTNVVLLFLVTLAWWGLHEGQPWLAAGAAAATVHMKPQYGLLLPLLWWIGERRVAARALLVAGLGLGASLVILGPTHHLQYLRYVLSMPDYLLTWTANLSPRATLHRLLDTPGQSRLLADGLTLAFDGGILAVFARALPRTIPAGSSALDWSWGLGLAAMLLLSPLTEEHHLVVLLLPLALLILGGPVNPMRPSDLVLLVGATLLLGSRYSLEQFPLFHQGWFSLLATGKLMGVAAVAWILLRRLRDSGRLPS